MTQYSTLLWLDSDTLVVRSLHSLLARADRSMSYTTLNRFKCSWYFAHRLVSPLDPRPGPRIGMVHDCDFYHYFLDHGTYPDEEVKGYAYSNSGVFLIKPG